MTISRCLGSEDKIDSNICNNDDTRFNNNKRLPLNLPPVVAMPGGRLGDRVVLYFTTDLTGEFQ